MRNTRALISGWLIIVLLLLGLSAGCSDVSSSPETVLDDLGREVTLIELPEKIISLMPSKTEKLFALGLGDKVVGVTDLCNYPEELAEKDIARVGDAFNLSLEIIVALEPDLIVANWLPEGMGEQLNSLGIPVFLTAPGGVEDTLDSILRLGRLTGRPQVAEKLVSELRRQINEITAATEQIGPSQRPKVLCLLDDSLFVAGKDTLQDELITMAGGINVVEESGWVELSEEALLVLDPDVILYTFPGGEKVLTKPEWQVLSSIQQGRVYKLDEDLCSRTGPRLVEGLQQVNNLLYNN
ncbi:MAG TPA: ABC transporter substrate-binding protein [Firmicutes bacterium]|nr:ABC transporter substrate-binding protein [Bacillota bacterium]